jgi:hypothetical protein
MIQDGAIEAAAFSWVADTVIGEAACVTLVRSSDPGHVGRSRSASLTQAAAELGDGPAIAVRAADGWVLVIEVNGWQGSRPEVLRRVSADTQAVSVFWNVNGQTWFSYAAAGEVVGAFEAMSPGQRQGTDPASLAEACSGLPWETADWVPLMLALTARLTGLRPEPEWLAGVFLIVPLEPLAEAVVPSVHPHLESLTYDDPPLAWAMRHSSGDPLRHAARAAAGYAAHAAGLGSHPDVAQALRPGQPPPAGLDRLAAAFERSAERSAGDPGAAGRFWAVTAVREAANPEPLAAAFKAASAAFASLDTPGLNAGALRAAVAEALGDPEPPAGSLGLTAVPGALPADQYRWVTAHWLAPAGVITYAIGITADSLAQVLGGDPARSWVSSSALAPLVGANLGPGWWWSGVIAGWGRRAARRRCRRAGT